jgi:osmotically inducible protein OsmC
MKTKMVWQGGIKDSKGTISAGSCTLKGYPYGFASRFEGLPGTNMGELLATAHSDSP